MTSKPEPADGKNAHSPSSQAVSSLHSLKLADEERRGSPGHSRRGGGSGFGRRRFFAYMSLVCLMGAAIGAYRGFPMLNRAEEVEAFVFSAKAEPNVLLDVSGYVVPRQKISVSSEIGGLVRQAPIQEGSRVKKGDLLLKIEDMRFKADRDLALAQYQAAQAQLQELENGSLPEEKEQAKAQYDQARHHTKLTRIEMMRASRTGPGGVSKAELDRNVSSYQEAEAAERVSKNAYDLMLKGPREERIAAARAEAARTRASLEKAEYLYRCTEVKSPIDGIVLEKKIEMGESVHPEVYLTPMITVADLAHMEADIPVQERDLALLNKSYECKIIPDAYSDRAYKGRFVPELSDSGHQFSRILPQVNRQRGVVQVRIAVLDPDSALLPDMNCRVLFLKEKKGAEEDLPVIPLKVRLQEGDESYVYVFDSATNRARRQVIECGDTIGNTIQVRKGLNQGDVILMPGDKPLDGKAVRPKLKAGAGQKGH